MSQITRHVYRGSVEFLTVTVTSSVPLDAQPVAISFGGDTWLEAAWIGTVGKQRKAQTLISNATLPPAGTYPLYVRITDSPEVPIVPAGTVVVHDV